MSELDLKLPDDKEEISLEEEKEFEISDNDFSNVSVQSLYIQEIYKHPLLTLEEEQKYGKDLKLYPQIEDMISKVKIKNHTEPILNLEPIFASITNEQDKNYIFEILSEYNYNYAKTESASDQALIYYMTEYNKLFKKIGHIPSCEELNSYFSQPNKYNIFTNFTNAEKIDRQNLIYKVSTYVKYMIAKTTMINSNLRLVISLAKRYITDGSNLELLDLISEGNRGLITAVERFDVDMGYRFSTYATWWIKQAITRSIHNTQKNIRIPVHMQVRYNKYRQKIRELEQLYNRQLTTEEILSELDISFEEYIGYTINTGNTVSLDIPVGEEDSRDITTLSEFIPSEENIEKIIESNELKNQVRLLLDSLDEREKNVIKLRFGLGEDQAPKTLDAIGKMSGITRERIRQIELKAIKKLRLSHNKRKLKPYIEP